ncbi:MAG: transposase, partial [Treponema sp.]|nr:transposase [Treponema sp.]
MKRYSEEDKAWLVEEWRASGKTKWAFARELGLPYQTFSKWTKGGEKEQNFVEVGMKLEKEGAEPG